jgi:serine phosphatase RsbU (regulator of sigma subunit)
MDTILLLSPEEQKLEKFLLKMGYEVFLPKGQIALKDVLNSKVLDLVVLDTALRDEAVDHCEFLRNNPTTKTVPIICLNNDRLTGLKIKDLVHDKIEMIPAPCSVGSLVAKIATQLRMRKMAGEDSISATLAEANASLRDLNSRFKQEREQARAIQLGLLPEVLPKSDKFEMAVSYTPLDEVGGDWYFINIKEDVLSLQVADVTGHGLAAAFVGCMTRLALTAANKEKPHELLKETNRLIAPHLPQGNFITICSLQYNVNTGDLVFANGGHPPALIFNKAENKITALKGTGYALGFFDDSDYAEVTAKLQKDDVLIVYTDGITEAQNRDGEQFGILKLGEVLKSSSAGTPDEIRDQILNKFHSFCDGRRLKDDITLIILKSR